MAIGDGKPLDSALVWLRRDLRLDDNAALYHALRSARKVWVAFVFDPELLTPLPRADRRVEFILGSLAALDQRLREVHPQARLITVHERPTAAIPRLATRLQVQAVYANHDDEPQALARDGLVRGALAELGVALHTSKDHVIFEREELLTGSGKPYSVFTPYRKAWLAKVDRFYLQSYRVHAHTAALAPCPYDLDHPLPTLSELGFEATNLGQLKLGIGELGAQALLADFLTRIDRYHQTRDHPALKGPSYLSAHLRFGTVSIRQLAREAHLRGEHAEGPRTWLSELIWRDFYHQILHHHPHVIGAAFKPAYDAIRWERGKHADALFDAWCQGQTGYPLVDAAMRQLLQSGYMHNRLRMVTASFLVKDLGIDWRRGEQHFAEHLNDFELASNNGGWQWAASTGCDAQPYFRIFNPVSQSERFDSEGKFIRRYVPELAGLDSRQIHAPWLARPVDLGAAGVSLGQTYPMPIVSHAEARERTLARYAVARSPTEGKGRTGLV